MSLAQSSETLPIAPPRMLEGMKPVPKKDRATPVPKMKPLRSSQIAEAVIESNPLITRAQMAEMIEPHAPYLAAAISACPEPDPDGEPNEQFFYAWTCLGALSLARKCSGILGDLLTAAEGQERAHFIHFEKHSSLRYSP